MVDPLMAAPTCFVPEVKRDDDEIETAPLLTPEPKAPKLITYNVTLIQSGTKRNKTLTKPLNLSLKPLNILNP